MSIFWLSRLWHHLMHKKHLWGRQVMINIRANLRHLVWTPDLASARKALWLFVVLLQVFLNAPCHFYAGHYLHILVSWVEFSMWKVTVPPWNHLCFSPVSSYEILIRRKHCFPLKIWSGLLQTASAITGVVNRLSFFFFVWLSNKSVSHLTAGDLADLPSVCPGEDLRLRRATGYVLVGDDTDQRHKERR